MTAKTLPPAGARAKGSATTTTYMYGRPGTASAALRQWAHEAILRHRAARTIPTTTRFLFYEAVMAGVIVKEKAPGEKGRRPDQNLSDALLWLREPPDAAPLVGWEEIQDRTRHVIDYTGATSVLAAAREAAEQARLDLWTGAPPLLVVESESLAGLLEAAAYMYRVVLIPVRGQSAGFLVNDVLPWIERGARRVLVLGDYDKAGADIEANAQRRLERHAGVDLDWRRLALTAEQIAQHQIPLVSRRDGRDGETRQVAECEAMPQAALMGLVEDALRTLLPQSLERVHVREARERRAVLRRLQ